MTGWIQNVTPPSHRRLNLTFVERPGTSRVRVPARVQGRRRQKGEFHANALPAGRSRGGAGGLHSRFRSHRGNPAESTAAVYRYSEGCAVASSPPQPSPRNSTDAVER